MIESEFIEVVSGDPTLSSAIRRAAEAGPRRRFDLGVTGVAALIFMFPIAQFILTRIGLPWLYEAGRFSELWRLRFHRWIDEQHRSQGFDPEEAEAAGEALRKELEATTQLDLRSSWERLRERMLREPHHPDAE